MKISSSFSSVPLPAHATEAWLCAQGISKSNIKSLLKGLTVGGTWTKNPSGKSETHWWQEHVESSPRLTTGGRANPFLSKPLQSREYRTPICITQRIPKTGTSNAYLSLPPLRQNSNKSGTKSRSGFIIPSSRVEKSIEYMDYCQKEIHQILSESCEKHWNYLETVLLPLAFLNLR